jgi:hypothetical protein
LPQLLDGHGDGSGNPSHAGFIAGDSDAGCPERFGELLLRQAQLLAKAFEFTWLHDVTNGYIMKLVLVKDWAA